MYTYMCVVNMHRIRLQTTDYSALHTRDPANWQSILTWQITLTDHWISLNDSSTHYDALQTKLGLMLEKLIRYRLFLVLQQWFSLNSILIRILCKVSSDLTYMICTLSLRCNAYNLLLFYWFVVTPRHRNKIRPFFMIVLHAHWM